jgi:hypothetical protein
MKSIIKNTLCFCALISLILSYSCRDNPVTPVGEMPTLTTVAATNMTQNAATSGGNITNDGSSPITQKGVCWRTTTAPTIADSKTTDGTGIGSFTSNMTGLIPNTTYYVRAYATNALGTGYGNEISFSTAPTIAIGQTYEGGLIFYVDATGQHGLIAADKDQGALNWGCQYTLISGTATALGTGLANTNAIVNQCSKPNIAARICSDLVLNGKSDWYLPSKDELNLLHQNLYLRNMGNLQTGRYWSSSQYNAQFAYCQLFNLNLNQLYYDKDLIAYSVRAIRTF